MEFFVLSRMARCAARSLERFRSSWSGVRDATPRALEFVRRFLGGSPAASASIGEAMVDLMYESVRFRSSGISAGRESFTIFLLHGQHVTVHHWRESLSQKSGEKPDSLACAHYPRLDNGQPC